VNALEECSRLDPEYVTEGLEHRGIEIVQMAFEVHESVSGGH
jgi:hypothetical protein